MNGKHSLRSRLWMLWLLALCLMAWMQVSGATPPLTTLQNFGARNSNNIYGIDGVDPWAGLIQGIDGVYYGVTYEGGIHHTGTVYKITTSGMCTTLYNFGVSNGKNTDGAYPQRSLIQNKDGVFYGVTSGGGSNDTGTVFKVTTSGILTTLYNFSARHRDGKNTDGVGPLGLIQGGDGALYGVTNRGGIHDTGTVFKITTSGTLTTLHHFRAREVNSNNDGVDPSGLIQGKDGALYGVTSRGGIHNTGTVFKITTSGTLTSLHNFSACDAEDKNTDGIGPDGLIQGKDGVLYGVTLMGGMNSTGTVFTITTSGTLTTLQHFSARRRDGKYMNDVEPGGLIQGKDGFLYGKTRRGGMYGEGTEFKISGAGAVIPLNSRYCFIDRGGTYGLGTTFEINGAGAFATIDSTDTEGVKPNPLIEGKVGDHQPPP